MVGVDYKDDDPNYENDSDEAGSEADDDPDEEINQGEIDELVNKCNELGNERETDTNGHGNDNNNNDNDNGNEEENINAGENGNKDVNDNVCIKQPAAGVSDNTGDDEDMTVSELRQLKHEH